MNLVICPACDAQVVRLADGTCPNCGKSAADVQPWWERVPNDPTVIQQTSDVASDVNGSAVRFGKRLTIVSYSVLILGGILVEVATLFEQRYPEPLGVLWTGLNALLFYRTLGGRQWSRYVTVSVNGLLACMFLLIVFSSTNHVQLIACALATAWLGIPSALLLFSPSVDIFVASRAPASQ